MRPDPGNSHLVGTRVLDRARVTDVFYPTGMRQDVHRHERASFSFVASGRYEECIGRATHSRQVATLIYRPAGENHAVAFESDVRIVSIELPDGTPDRHERGASHRSELVAWLGSRLGREMARVDAASTLAIDGIVAELLVEGSRRSVLSKEDGAAKWLTRATDFVNDNFTYPMSLDEIARVAGVHSAHLSRVFRQKMGCTVGEYVRRLRFEYACQQILSTERRLCDVAQEAGFSDQSHFNRLFQTKMGTTPFIYRKLHRAL